jgi:nucleotide-binding universal stress UspA family protein
MKNFRKIMLATDFSKTSEKALETALAFKDKFGCFLDVVHVFDASTFEMPAPYYFMPGVNEWVDNHFNEVKEKGRQALKDMLPGLGDDCSGHFIEGRTKEKVLEFAKENDIDLIVLGTHGHSGFNHFVLGSVAETIVRKAHCPVLVVRGDAE